MSPYETARVEREEAAAHVVADVSALLASRVRLPAETRIRLAMSVRAYHDAADKCAEAATVRRSA